MSETCWESIDGLSLVENGLEHILFEASRPKPSYFRVTREAHHILYCSMVQALTRGAGIGVTAPLSPPIRYGRDGQSWEIHREPPVPGCNHVWRFSAPVACPPPELPPASEHLKSLARDATRTNRHLIGFCDALAMIQTDCYMGRYMYATPVLVSDEEMSILEGVHDDIRNMYEHLTLDLYSAPGKALRLAAALCLRLTESLLFKSGTVVPDTEEHPSLKSLVASCKGWLEPTSRQEASAS